MNSLLTSSDSMLDMKEARNMEDALLADCAGDAAEAFRAITTMVTD